MSTAASPDDASATDAAGSSASDVPSAGSRESDNKTGFIADPDSATIPTAESVASRRWTLARKQALLTAVATFLASLLIGGSLYIAAANSIQQQIETRFRSLANERERYVEALVRQQYERVEQIAGRPSLRRAITQTIAQPIAARSPGGQRIITPMQQRADELLADTRDSLDRVRRIDIINRAGRILASSEPNRTGAAFDSREFLVSLQDVEGLRPYLSAPGFAADGSPVVLAAAPMIAAETLIDRSVPAAMLVEVDPESEQAAAGEVEVAAGAAFALVVATVQADRFMDVLNDVAAFGESATIGIADAADVNAILGPAAEMDTIPPEGFLRLTGRDTRGEPGDEIELLTFWQPFYFNPGEATQRRFIVSIEAEEAYAPLTRLRRLIVGVGCLMTVLLTVLSYFAARRLGQRLSRLTFAAETMASSGTIEPIAIQTHDEVGTLTSAFNTMGRRVEASMNALRADATREREVSSRLKAEIEVAQEIQSCLYPSEPLDFAGYEVDGRSLPAELLCGDYFDYFAPDLPDGGRQIIFATGDVSGHGVGPSLLMVEVRGVLRNTDWSRQSLPEAISRLNRVLVDNSPDGRFVTLLLGRVHCDTGVVEYVGAGHRGLYIGTDGTTRDLKSTGLVLGLTTGMPYDVETVHMAPGDRFCVASDGIEETIGTDEACFGWGRLCDTLVSTGDRSLKDQINTVFAAAAAHSGGCDPADDCTLLLLRRTVSR